MLKLLNNLKTKWERVNKKNSLLFKLDLFLQKCPLTKKYIANITNIYRIIKPTDEYTISIYAVKLFLKAHILSIIVFLICVNRKGTTIYNIMMILSLIYIVHAQIINGSLLKEEYKLLKQFEKYLGEVRHYFHDNGIVEEAIYDSFEEADYEISLHINKIYDLIVLEDSNEISEYKEVAPNKYFMTFLALCQATITYGDTICDNQSLFLTNLNYLKNEINVELLKRDKIKHLFSGLIFMTILPIFFLKAIENWSLSNLPELEKYYYGAYGIIVTVVIFLSTLITYHIINQLKHNSRLYRKEHAILEKIGNINTLDKLYELFLYYRPAKANKIDSLLKRISEGITLKQFLLQKLLIFLISIMSITLIILNIISISKWNELNSVKDFELTSFISNSKENVNYQEVIKKYTNQYVKKYRILCENKNRKNINKLDNNIKKNITNQIANDISKVENVKNEYTVSLLTKEVIERLRRYNNINYHWYYFFFTMLISYFLCNIPYLLLNCKKHFLRMSMEDEVIQFQSIIMMLMYIKRMNVETILEWLENFSDIFKNAIIECVDNYSYDDRDALLKLKEEEPFLPFIRIVENLEVCDRIGIEKAFDEIASERSFFTEKRKQENEIFITNKAVIGKVVAYIPLFLTLSLYLIVPFVLESITKLMNYVNQLEGI